MKKFYLVGKSLPYTLSKQIHQMLGNDNYEICELENINDLSTFLKSAKFDGLNITAPYKKEVMPLLDVVSDEARLIGAINTVVKKGEKLFGYNTDISGLEYALKQANIVLNNKKVLILGTGGAALTAKYCAQKANASEISLVGRTSKLNYTNIYDNPQSEVIINATPLGTFPNIDDCPIDLSKFKNVTAVFDLVYNPLKTTLSLNAQKYGINSENGLSMLVEQARRAEELFFNKSIPQSENESITCKLKNQMRNIVLIGMPSSGKTTVGKLLSKKLNKAFFDTDLEIEKHTKCSVESIINDKSEGYFRQIESEIIEEAGKKTNLVIASGGGSVISEKNRERLKHNGFFVFLNRDINNLCDNGRPLSKMYGNEKLFRDRIEIYKGLCDIEICSCGSPQEVLEEILTKL